MKFEFLQCLHSNTNTIILLLFVCVCVCHKRMKTTQFLIRNSRHVHEQMTTNSTQHLSHKHIGHYRYCMPIKSFVFRFSDCILSLFHLKKKMNKKNRKHFLFRSFGPSFPLDRPIISQFMCFLLITWITKFPNIFHKAILYFARFLRGITCTSILCVYVL